MTEGSVAMAVAVMVEPTSIRLLAQSQVLVLRECEGRRLLVIPIGRAEAASIALALLQTPLKRPLTHDLLCATVAALGATVQHVHVHLLEQGIYHTRIVLRGRNGYRAVEARISDGVAVAVRLAVPILVEEQVFDAGLVVQLAPGHRPEDQEPREARIPEAALAPYYEVVDRLQLEDL
jgi:bifunctional DNase/RNase